MPATGVQRLKTVEYVFPAKAGANNNVQTDLTQITISIPESSVSFRSVIAEITLMDGVTATGGTFTVRTIGMQLNASGYTTVASSVTLANTGENIALYHSADFTSLFVASWSGSSMTCDARVTFNQSTGTNPSTTNICVKLIITYSYDQDSSTHLKTVRIPFDSPASNIGFNTMTYIDAMPNLSTFLPESGVAIKDCFLTVEGNISNAGNNTTKLLSGSVNSFTWTGAAPIICALGTDCYFRYHWKAITGVSTLLFNTGVTGTVNLSQNVSAGFFNHIVPTMTVTYTFTPGTTTTVLNSVQLPMEMDSPMGGPVTGDVQRGSREFWIEEPDPIVTKNCGYYLSWSQANTLGGLQVAVGTGPFKAYTDTAAAMGGGNALQKTGNLSLSRGRNTLKAAVYRTDLTDLGMNVGGYWTINYHSAVSASGVGAHNRTVKYPIRIIGSDPMNISGMTTGITPPSPVGNYFISSIGVEQANLGGVALGGTVLQTEILGSEGGTSWENIYADICTTDAEVGVTFSYSTARSVFYRYPEDNPDTRINPFSARRWRYASSAAASNHWHFNLWYTYHEITFGVTGVVSGYTGDGSNIDLNLYRIPNHEWALSGSTTSGGNFHLKWYDNVESVYLTALQNTRVGRSLNDTAI